MTVSKRSLQDRLDSDGVLCAEGFLFEIERRGYMASGAFVPEVALDNPQALRALHRDFQHAGSDVVEAFTYNGHREKMRVLGKENLLEPLNKAALQIAREVAESPPDGEPNLFAGNINNTNIWNPDDKNAQREARRMFDEVCGWAADAGADFIVGETFYYAEEAFCALEAIQQIGLPAVPDHLADGRKQNARRLGNCRHLRRVRIARGGGGGNELFFRGPPTMMPYIRQIRARLKGHIAALPVAFRTTESHPTFFNLPDDNNCACPSPHGRPFPTALEPTSVNRYEIRAFAEEAWNLGVRYLGVCCGAAPIYIREVAEAMGRTPPASKYREDISRQFMYGNHERLPKHITEYGGRA